MCSVPPVAASTIWIRTAEGRCKGERTVETVVSASVPGPKRCVGPYAARMIFLVALVVGLIFGAVDQYLGTLHVTLRLGWWTLPVSQMSALWLLVPFLVGGTQERSVRAALVGLVATFAALSGYLLMGYGPAEGHPFTDVIHGASGWARSNVPWIVGGAVIGPLFGYLGARWRTRRSALAAAVVAGSFLLEPLVRVATGRLLEPTWIWAAEAFAGAALGAVFIATRRRGPAHVRE